jgi:hypothetical protein
VGKWKGWKCTRPANLYKTEKDARRKTNNTIILLQAKEENKIRN